MKETCDKQLKLGLEKGSVKLIYYCMNFLMEAYPDPQAMQSTIEEGLQFFKEYYNNEDNVTYLVQ